MPFANKISEDSEFPPEAGRYHLYVALGCPFAHRALLARALKGLEDVISLSVVHYLLGPEGWRFATPEDNLPDCIPDTVNNFNFMKEVYLLADKDYEGRITVPVLFDKKTKKIVSNESADIIRIFSSSFNKLAKNPEINFRPEDLASDIDTLNKVLDEGYVTCVYKAGFATEQTAYETAAKTVRDTLVKVDGILKENGSGWLVGNQLTESDLRLFPTILRHDPVYFGLYKCNLVATKDLSNVLAWMKRIYSLPGVEKTVNMDQTRKMYYMSGKTINPTGIVPLYDGPLFE